VGNGKLEKDAEGRGRSRGVVFMVVEKAARCALPGRAAAKPRGSDTTTEITNNRLLIVLRLNR